MFNFKGRINRRNYWVGHIVYSIVFLLFIGATFAGIEYFAKNSSITVAETASEFFVILMILSLILYCIAQSSLMVRRAHDINNSGTLWVLGNFVISGIVGIVLGCIAGNNGNNQYGTPDHGSAKLDSFLTFKFNK